MNFTFTKYLDIDMSSTNQKDKCYVCYQTDIDTLKCVHGDKEKVVRTFMHPTDDIEFTLYVFGATVECFNKNSKKLVKPITKIVYDEI